MSISPARAAAFDILLRIARERAYSSVLLPQHEERLAAIDRGLCHELVLGTLRRQMQFDRIIDQFASGKKVDIEVRIAIRLGLLQLLHLDRIPPSAAINDSVDLVKRAKKTSAAGFVNAVLRRATREQPAAEFDSEFERISFETSHPQWLVERWAANLGAADTEQLARANNEAAATSFRVIGEADSAIAELTSTASSSKSVDGCYLIDRSTPLLRKLAGQNKIYLQDEASQLVAHAVTFQSNGLFFDVCAAPGGKTALVTALRGPKLAVAGDLYPSRVELLSENCRRQNVDVEVLLYDATALPISESSFDAVLVDAPCSGTGTIRHNPEIRYFLEPRDIPELSFKQRSLLGEASKAVKKGGLLVYSTCSLEQAEGEDVANRFLTENRAFEQVIPAVPERFRTAPGFARTWPHKDGMDGFFIAAFRRS